MIVLSFGLGPAGTAIAEVNAEPDMSPEANAVYHRTDRLMREASTPGNGDRMLELVLPVARREPHPLLLSRLVVAAAAVASAPDGRRRVEELLAAARRPEADALDRFVAGVAVHYRGHVRGESRGAKSADYRRAIALLEPLRERFGASPRLWIYLAVSYARTGRHREAAAAIERAVAADDGGDADVYYCRAEVWHRLDPARAIADIDRYLAVMRRNKAHGGWSAPDKQEMVEAMRVRLAAVVAGEQPPAGVELFDPVRVPPREPELPDWAWESLVVLAVTAAGAWRWAARRGAR